MEIQIRKTKKGKHTKRVRIPADILRWAKLYRINDKRPYLQKPSLAEIYQYLFVTGLQLVTDNAVEIEFQNLLHEHDTYSVLFFDEYDTLADLRAAKEMENLKRLETTEEELLRTEDMMVTYMRLTINFLN